MKAVKRAIIICWAMLIVCFIIKLFGGNWFEIICDNEHFIFVCGFIDQHWYIKYPVMFISYIPSLFFVILACSFIQKPNARQTITIILTLVIVWGIGCVSLIAKTVLEILAVVVLPIVLNTKHFYKDTQPLVPLKKMWFNGIIGYVLITAFQLLSLITRNIGIKITDFSTLLTFILMIDYYIMVILFCLYVRLYIKHKKGGE